MTKEEKKEIIRIYGKDYDELDIPSYIRNREKLEVEERLLEDLEREQFEKSLKN